MDGPETACNVTQSPPAEKRGVRSGNRGDERGRIVIGNSGKEVTSVGKWKWIILKRNIDKYGVKKGDVMDLVLT
jgi:hypothetical protein